MNNRPQNIFEFFQNIKHAFDEDVFATDTGFSEEKITPLFGGELKWLKNDEKRKCIEIVQNSEINSIGEMVSIRVDKTMKDENKIEIKIRVNTQNPDRMINFEQIEAVFGRGWEEYVYWPPIHGLIVHQRTHPMGNKNLKYLNENGHILISLSKSGSLSSLFALREITK